MTRAEYEKICRATFSGEDWMVENKALHEKGKIFNCQFDTFNVQVGGEWRQWGRQVCEAAGRVTAGERGRG